MADFGWAYLSGAVTGEGPAKAIQYLKTNNGELTGSANFTFDQTSQKAFLTGSMIISGTIQAHTFDVIQTNKIEISSSGDSNFGTDSGDTHTFSGSVNIVSGAFRNSYYKIMPAAIPYQIKPHETILGVSSSAYSSITLPDATTVGAGRIIIIKDEFQATRIESTKISVSGSGSQTIDHSTTYDITGDSAALSLYCDGISKWFIY